MNTDKEFIKKLFKQKFPNIKTITFTNVPELIKELEKLKYKNN